MSLKTFKSVASRTRATKTLLMFVYTAGLAGAGTKGGARAKDVAVEAGDDTGAYVESHPEAAASKFDAFMDVLIMVSLRASWFLPRQETGLTAVKYTGAM